MTFPSIDFSRRDETLTELMDDPHCDPQRLHATLRRFGVVNRMVSGWDAVYRSTLRPLLAGLDREGRVLDIGSGGGDVVARLARLARRDGLQVRWTGADPDPRALAVARERSAPGLTFEAADADELVRRGDQYDAVISNHVIHHLDRDELRRFTSASLQLATSTVLHGDIARSRLAYALFAAGITPVAPGTFLRTDGLRSIRRSYVAGELATELGSPWTVSEPAPFRLIAQARGTA